MIPNEKESIGFCTSKPETAKGCLCATNDPHDLRPQDRCIQMERPADEDRKSVRTTSEKKNKGMHLEKKVIIALRRRHTTRVYFGSKIEERPSHATKDRKAICVPMCVDRSYKRGA